MLHFPSPGVRAELGYSLLMNAVEQGRREASQTRSIMVTLSLALLALKEDRYQVTGNPLERSRW